MSAMFWQTIKKSIEQMKVGLLNGNLFHEVSKKLTHQHIVTIKCKNI
jgi:hypothetical protein